MNKNSDKMTLCRDGKVSVGCYLVAAIIAVLPDVLLRLDFDAYPRETFRYLSNIDVINNIPRDLYVHLAQFVTLNVIVLLAFRGFTYQVAVRSTFLGYVFGLGILISITSEPSLRAFGVYMAILATFHYSEFLVIAWTNPSAATIDTFVLQHSWAYSIAALSSWIEFFVERYFFHSMKELSAISYIGLALCIGGEALRKIAIFTAKRNFNHIVQSKKSEDHELVTYGVYGLCRHPSYVGWFYWSIGTQVVLQNPICLLAYTLASWRFFHDRVFIEEITLQNFFGEAYIEYQNKVGTGLPFISGYQNHL